MGAEPDGALKGPPHAAREAVTDYCRAIERYLCQKNDGHLIRVIGPSFDLVSGWSSSGIPLKVAFEGIDRFFERYYRRGPRRRPVRIDHCAADVLDVFDEWRRAVGVGATTSQPGDEMDGAVEPRRGPSLTAHLERVLMKLSSARAMAVLGAESDSLLDRISGELDVARAASGGLRGEARSALIERLVAADEELMQMVRRSMDDASRRAIESEASVELETFRERMAVDQFARAHRALADRLLRERLGLPVVAYS
jgi:hypothetical protein